MKYRFVRQIVIVLVAALSIAAQEKPLDTLQLTPGTTVEREITGGHTQSFVVTLQRGQFLRAVVNSHNIDVAATVYGPAGRSLLTADLLKYPAPEPVSLEAEQSGEYRLEVHSDVSSMVHGRYEITSELKPQPSETDRQRLAAEQLLIEANNFEREGAQQSLRKAIEKRAEAIVLWRKLGDRYWEAYSIHYSGRAASTLNKLGEAIAFYSEALKIRREIGDKIGESATLNNAGLVYLALRESSTALDYYNQAIALSKAIGDSSGVARTLTNLGSLFDTIGQKQQALERFNQALSAYRTIGDKSGEGNALINVGNVNYALGQQQKALEFYNQALPLFRVIADRSGESSALTNIGLVYIALGEKQKALDFYNQGLAIYRATKDKNNEATTLVNIGIVSSDLGEKQKALDFYTQALTIYRTLADKQGEGNTLSNVGTIYYALREYQKALEFYTQALPLERASGAKIGEANTLLNIGLTYSALNEKQKAFEFYYQALTIYHELNNKQGEAKTLNNIGVNYYALNDKQKALEYYTQALRFFVGIGDKSGSADVLNSIGGIYGDRAELRRALEFYEQALPLRQAVGDKAGEVVTLMRIGIVLASLGEKQKALTFYNRALPLCRTAGDKANEAALLHNLAEAYRDLGEMERALEFYNQALPLFRSVNDRLDEGHALIGMGVIYQHLGNLTRALELFDQALPIYRAIGNRKGEALTFGNIGNSYIGRDNQKALEYFTRAVEIFQAIGDPINEANALLDIGISYAGIGERQKALEFYDRALPVLRKVGDKNGEANTLANIGIVYSFLGDRQKALQFLNEALPLKRAVGDKAGEAAILVHLMLQWKVSGKPVLAIFYGKQAINNYQQLRGNIQGLEKQLQKSFLVRVEFSYRSLADLLIAQGRIPEAERVLEMLKEEEYFQYARRDKAVASALLTRADLRADEQEALDEYSQIADQLTGIGSELSVLETERLTLPEDVAFPKQARLDELKGKLAAAIKSFQVFQRQLEEQFGKTNVRVADVESGLQSDLKAWGTSDAVIISTIIGADRLQIIVTTANVQEPHTIEISASKLNGLVADFRNALKDPRIDPRPAGQKLYDVLLKPIETDLEGAKAKTLVWSLDGTLRYVPIAALWDGKHYLVERFQNVVIALASRSKMAREPLAVGQWRALGLGVSKGWGNFAPLAAVPEELKGIVRQDNLGGTAATDERGVLPGRRLLDADFTRNNLERALGRYSIIHIASHFDFLPGKEKSSFLLLGDGTGLTLDAISASTPLFDKVELLTLSACNTATGSDAEGAEVEGFGVLAQKQGALAVLATLWEVADASTGQLMREFYRLREANPQWTKSEALRQAQLELLTGQTKVPETRTQRAEIVGGGTASTSQPSFTADANAPFAHPYYWAPFILIGNWK